MLWILQTALQILDKYNGAVGTFIALRKILQPCIFHSQWHSGNIQL